MKNLQNIKDRFSTPLLFSDLSIKKIEILNEKIEITFQIGSVVFTITEEFSVPITQKNLSVQKLAEYLALTKAFKYTQHFLCPTLTIHSSILTAEEQNFWKEYFLHYSMELFYTEQLPIELLCKLTFVPTEKPIPEQTSLSLKPHVLLGVGGGKDAIYAFELLQNTDFKTDLFYAYENASDQELRRKLSQAMMDKQNGTQVYSAWRNEIESSEIKETILRQKANGIKPSAPAASVNAIRMLIMAIEKGYSYITTANEKSADTAITEYYGYPVNHQYSKSIQFEKEFSALIKQHIDQKLHYFSILKPVYEIRIAEQVAKLPEYFGSFTSCNRSTSWCYSCSKCAFVFTLFAAFLPPSELQKLFPVNLFDAPEVYTDFEELMGIKGVRPFECVGDKDEVNYSMYLAKKLGHTGKVIDLFLEKIEPTLDHEQLSSELFTIYDDTSSHCIPPVLLKQIRWNLE